MRLSERLAGSARRFRLLLAEPRAAQEHELAAILRRNVSTAWGRAHGFATIRDAAEYARRVPISRYDDLRPWIERCAAGEAGVLVNEPIVAFEETGGSSAGAKLVPCTNEGLAAFRRGLLPWLDDLCAAHPDLDEGAMYWSISPACRAPRVTPGGVPIGLGSDAAYFGDELAGVLLESMAVPPDVGGLADIGAWRDATLNHLLARRDLRFISVWSPTFLTELLRHTHQDPREAWPMLRVISCWDQGTARPHAARLRAQFPGVHVQGKGLLATEGLVSIPLAGLDAPVLALESGFFEFVDASGEAHTADGVEAGGEYALLMTTHAGFYRYAIGDRVRVVGFAGRTPQLEFLGRGELASDLRGEKLTDDFVAAALDPLGLGFTALAPDPGAGRYVLVLDEDEVSEAEAAACARRVDEALRANPQYAYACRLGQLGLVAPRRCDQPLQRWIDRGLGRGQRLGDVKVPALVLDADWLPPQHDGPR